MKENYSRPEIEIIEIEAEDIICASGGGNTLPPMFDD